nr:sporulation protein YunB [Bacillus sp. FJAT-27251]
MAKMGLRLRRKGPLPFRHVLLITLLFFSLSTVGGLWLIDKGIEPTLMSYAESQTRKIATLVINKAINEQVVSGMQTTDLIEYVPIDGGSRTVIQYNAEVLNKIKAETVSLVQMNINEAQKGNLSALESLADVEFETEQAKSEDGMVYYVPLGQATKNALLGNHGPRIPVKFTAIGDVISDVVWNQKPLGINNTWIDASIRIIVNVQIIIPFATEIATIQEDIPIGGFLHPGEVPQFFNNGGGGVPPAVELPSKKNNDELPGA